MTCPNEIADITNTVHNLLMEADTAGKRLERVHSIAKALHLSCDFLSQLIQDDVFFEYERVVVQGNKESILINCNLKGGAVELVSMDLHHFERFLEGESKLLQNAGFSIVVTDFIIKEIRSGIEKLRHNQVSGLALEGAISRLRRYVCKESDKMARLLHRERPIRSFILGLGGVGLISINIAAQNILSAVGIGASSGIGGALVVDSVRILTEEFLPF